MNARVLEKVGETDWWISPTGVRWWFDLYELDSDNFLAIERRSDNETEVRSPEVWQGMRLDEARGYGASLYPTL